MAHESVSLLHGIVVSITDSIDRYRKNINLTAIIYLHKISDNRMTGSLLKNLQMFTNLCGQQAMPHVVIATTMWGNVDKVEGAEREDELRKDFWKESLEHGCTTARFDKTFESAWRIIGSISGETTLLIQQQMASPGSTIHQTNAVIHANNATPPKRLLTRLRSLFSW